MESLEKHSSFNNQKPENFFTGGPEPSAVDHQRSFDEHSNSIVQGNLSPQK
jgi:hypothetical protein